jgi:hypothetical protein
LEVCDGADNNCNGSVDDVALPQGSPSLSVSRSGADVQLTWSPISGATSFDVVRGGLNALRGSGGNFTTALDECTGNNVIGFSLSASGSPAVGDGFFFLVRGTVTTCAAGTYDSGAVAQAGSRDAEIAASGVACP